MLGYQSPAIFLSSEHISHFHMECVDSLSFFRSVLVLADDFA